MQLVLDGTVRDKYRYRPFGGVESGQNINVGQSYRFTGKPVDEELDMDWYYYGARYYDPGIGRFLAVDPLASMDPSLSPYAYAGNNPLGYVDEQGLYRSRQMPNEFTLVYNSYKKRWERLPVYRPMWEGPTNSISAWFTLIPYLGIALSVGDGDDSFHILKDGSGAVFELISRTDEYKRMAGKYPNATKWLGRVLVSWSVWQIVTSYSDPTEVMVRYARIEAREGPCTNDRCVHDRMKRIVDELNAEKAGSKLKIKNKKTNDTEEADVDGSDDGLPQEDPFGGWDAENRDPPPQ